MSITQRQLWIVTDKYPDLADRLAEIASEHIRINLELLEKRFRLDKQEKQLLEKKIKALVNERNNILIIVEREHQKIMEEYEEGLKDPEYQEHAVLIAESWGTVDY